LLSGLLALTAFLVSLYRAWRLYMMAPAPGTTLIYHFSLYIPDNRDAFFDDVIRGAEQAAAELDSAISIHSIDPARNELETAAYTGVDGLVVCPYLDDALARRQLEKLKEHQLPVVLINHNIPSARPWPFIGTNNFDMGRRIGLLLEESSGPVRLAVVYSDKAPGIYAERELVEMGISAALEQKLAGPIRRFRTNLNPLDAETLLMNIFHSPGGRDYGGVTGNAGGGTGNGGDSGGGREPAGAADINAIVFTDSADTVAAAQTLVDMNLVGRVQVIGFGEDPFIIDSIRKGIVSSSVVIDSERIGYEAVKALAALRTTGYTSTSVDTGIRVITAGSLPGEQ
jgi:ribose transport system substrate-binding protein